MAVGKVVKFDETRGFGFIAPAGGTEDVFLHANDLLIPESLVKPGVTVVFDIDEGERGLKASNIHLPDNAPRPDDRGRSSASASSASSSSGLDDDADEGIDVLTADEFSGQVTELLLSVVPSLTGEQVLNVRRRLIEFAKDRGWLMV
ncbi:MAG TPA: cold shock domain-containing protein [Actinocrinis sp.]|jgi:cold shock CspA family protein